MTRSRVPRTFDWVGEVTDRDRADFWSRVEMHEGVRQCWEWRGTLIAKDGYGRFLMRGRSTLAHRMAYFLAYSQDPGIAMVLHSCDNAICVNPRHLRLGTVADNGRDREVSTVMASMFRFGVKRPSRRLPTPRQPRLRRPEERQAGRPRIFDSDGNLIDRRAGENKNKLLTNATASDLRAEYWRGGTTAEAIAAARALPADLVIRILTRRSFSLLPQVDGEPLRSEVANVFYASRAYATRQGKSEAAKRAWVTRRANGRAGGWRRRAEAA